MKTSPSTGNAIVDAIGQLEDKFIGVLVPYPWYNKVLDKRGRPYHLAILILAVIVGWYRPNKKLSKHDNTSVYHKRFKRDRLQLSRGDMAKKFNTDEDTVTHALNHLVNLGAIGKECHDIVVQGHTYRNSLFVWPISEVIEKLCEVVVPVDESAASEPSEVAPMMEATWPASQGPHTPHDGGDVAACKGPRGPVDPGDVAPMMGVDTGTTPESDRNSTATTTGNPQRADAPAAVVAVSKHAGASPPAPPASSLPPAASAPQAQAANRARKVSSKSSQGNGAERQHADKQPSDDTENAPADSGPEALAADGEDADAPQHATASKTQARKLLQVFERFYPQYFDRDYRLKEQDKIIATRYFADYPDRSALEVANYLLRAWELSDQKNGDYGYACCKQAKTVAGFFKFLERRDGKRGIAEDVESRFYCYWGGEDESLLKCLRTICGAPEVVSDIFADELRQVKMDENATNEAEAKQSAAAARQAEIVNPTTKELNSARDTVLQAYEIALGIRKGRSAPFALINSSCRALERDLPALREWYSHDDRRSSPTDLEPELPDTLRQQLQAEMNSLANPVTKSPSSGDDFNGAALPAIATETAQADLIKKNVRNKQNKQQK